LGDIKKKTKGAENAEMYIVLNQVKDTTLTNIRGGGGGGGGVFRTSHIIGILRAKGKVSKRRNNI